MGNIDSTFAALREKKQLALMPFIPAGYPDLAITAALLPAMEQAGANLIEIGIPFSDPIADGPTIQAAFTAALAKGLKLAEVFDMVRSARAKVSIPLVAMVSYSIVYRYGLERFAADARKAGFDGLILPDLPPPEAAAVCAKVQAAGLSTTLLVAPTTSEKRRKEIADLSNGFIYYLSVSGITGERDRLPDNIESNLRQLRGMTRRPVCVGFGISKPEHLAQLAPVADGAIVGSAIVKKITQAGSADPQEIARVVGDYCRSLLTQVR
ncbi:MAG: tryptophan synthase, alpha subunit [Phycisphaerales bacterium]|nr:tryptophan synthase, alpha subunit [Phycisphaerales bacterium]